MQRQDIVIMQGGIDLITQAIALKPGYLIASQNYESEMRGYRRCQGYERFDGMPAPSEAVYSTLDFDSASQAITAGETVTGSLSGAEAVVLADNRLGY